MRIESAKPFQWNVFILALIPTGLVTFLVALLLDQLLVEIGVNIHPWHEAAIAGFLGAIFSIPAVPILWHVGLRTLPQYMLGGLALFVPSTLLSLAIISYFYSVTFELTDMAAQATESQKWALTLYIRISRSGLLVPVHILSFYLIYHRFMNRLAR